MGELYDILKASGLRGGAGGGGGIVDAYTKAETDVLLSGKQDTLSTAQLSAVNSGIDSEKVDQIETNMNELAEIKSDLGIIVLTDYSRFIRGRVTAGTVYTDRKYRAISEDIIHADQDMNFIADEGFKFGFSKYNSDGEYIAGSETTWLTNYVMNAGENFRITIARTVEDTTEIADINEFLAAIKVTSDIIIEYDYSFTGELTTKVKRYNAKRLAVTTPGIADHTRQGVAYYDGIIFQFYAEDTVCLIDYETGTVINTLAVDSAHGDNASFSNEFYDVNDEFPLCYITTDETPAKVNVVRITRTETTLIRTLTFPFEETGYYSGHVLDTLNNTIYMLGYKINSATNPLGNETILAKYRLDSLTENQDGSYTPALIKQFGYAPFIYVMQGMCLFDNKLCICSGSHDSSKKSKVFFVNSENGEILSVMEEFPDEVKDTELEGAFFKKNETNYSMVLSLQNGRLYEITFE